MSRARVITGTDEHGRPVSHWADAPATDTAYGFMEPAHEPVLTRRQATRAELAAAVARETPKGYLNALPIRESRPVAATWDGMATAERMRASRARGAERSHPQPTYSGPVHPIVAEVAALHGVTVAGLVSRSQSVPLVDARCEAIRRMRAETRLSLRAIGAWLGPRSHNAVLQLLRKVTA